MRDSAFGVTTEAQAREDVQQLSAKHPDLIKIWVDDRNGTVEKLRPSSVSRHHRRSARSRRPGHGAYRGARRRQGPVRAGIDGFGHVVRDRDVDDELLALLKSRPNVFFVETLWGERQAIYQGRPGWIDAPIVHDLLSPEEVTRLAESFSSTASPAPAQRESARRLLRNVATLKPREWCWDSALIPAA